MTETWYELMRADDQSTWAAYCSSMMKVSQAKRLHVTETLADCILEAALSALPPFFRIRIFPQENAPNTEVKYVIVCQALRAPDHGEMPARQAQDVMVRAATDSSLLFITVHSSAADDVIYADEIYDDKTRSTPVGLPPEILCLRVVQ
nr:hypothetical protein CFP56_28858 [Quercus suber]